MELVFVVGDDFHAEWMGKFPERHGGVVYLRRLAALP
jgi:hypothetical protein